MTRRLLYGTCGAAMGGLIGFSVMAGTTSALVTVATVIGVVAGGALSMRYGDAFWQWLSERLRWLA